MTKYLVHCTTTFCGADNTYRVEAEENAIDQEAYNIAYNNFLAFFGVDDIAESEGLDIDNPEDLEKCEDLIDCYINYDFEEFKGSDEEWQTYLEA